MDFNYSNLSRHEVLRKYKADLDVLRRCAREQNISDEQFDQLVTADINRLALPRRPYNRRIRDLGHVLDRNRKIVIYITIFLFLYAVIFYKTEVTSLLLRNIQVYIYPVMKLWRKITAPMILFFPSLTGKICLSQISNIQEYECHLLF